MKKIIRTFYLGIRYFYRIGYSFFHSFKIANSKSYFPEEKRKAWIVRYLDNLLLSFKGEKCNWFYNLYGFDIVKKRDKSDYVSEGFFWKTADSKNGLIEGNHNACIPGSQIFYLRDKYAFYHFMKSHDLPVPEVFAFLQNGKYYDYNMNEIPMDDLKKRTDFFVKDLDGECASFVKHIAAFEDLKQFENLSQGRYILQDAVHQSEQLNKINPKSINTFRIVTINKQGNTYVLSALLRVGTSKTGNVDNWAAGGLAVGINEEGRLAEYGFYKPRYGTKAEVHPDTGVVFAETVIEDFKAACDVCCKAHKYFYNVHSIGWDVALTENGPVFIEGNDNWELSLMQACNGGLKQWEKAIR